VLSMRLGKGVRVYLRSRRRACRWCAGYPAAPEESTLPTALIIGAGPAGLTAAWELSTRTDYQVRVVEATDTIGGISRTVVHNGNRIDIGGHRFFSKVDRVMDWWLEMLPLEAGSTSGAIRYQGKSRNLDATNAPKPEDPDRVMLVRNRKSRIYYASQFFDYPIRLTPDTVRKLGVRRTARIGLSYARARLRPREETSLEDFFINRFGRELYETFFKEYTEKVWGVPCREISAEWGAQRVKGLSVTKALEHFFRAMIPRGGDLAQRRTETSLIERFMYPKHGPGQMWEEVARRLRERGVRIDMGWKVRAMDVEGTRVRAVTVEGEGGVRRVETADIVFSTMPVRSLVRAMGAAVPPDVLRVAEGLQYRDFITVGLLVDRLAVHEQDGGRITDNWIYVQEPGVKVGRLQVFNNWSPHMVADPALTWIGLEYFCQEGDALWRLDDAAMTQLGIDELVRIGILPSGTVRDSVVIRVPKTYPAYFGSWADFDRIRAFTDSIENLYLIGRNGMHRYNNQDHSMLTAMVAVDNIVAGRADKANIWEVNTEEEYHEEK
jgi:protoporphyrinogen oxidase